MDIDKDTFEMISNSSNYRYHNLVIRVLRTFVFDTDFLLVF